MDSDIMVCGVCGGTEIEIIPTEEQSVYIMRCKNCKQVFRVPNEEDNEPS